MPFTICRGRDGGGQSSSDVGAKMTHIFQLMFNPNLNLHFAFLKACCDATVAACVGILATTLKT